MTRVNGSVDGSNQAMNGKVARQAVMDGTGATGTVGAGAGAARRAYVRSVRVQALAASGELGDELLQKVNGDLKAWHGNKLAHGVSVVSAGSNVRAR